MDIRFLFRINWLKKLYINLKFLPLKQGIRLPIIVGNRTRLEVLEGKIIINGPISTGMISFGLGGSSDLFYFEKRNSYLGLKSGGKLIFNGRAHFAVHVSVLVVNSEVVIGDGFSCNNGCKISSVAGIVFGSHCLLGGNVAVRDSDGHFVFDLQETGEKGKQHNNKSAIYIGDHVWLTNNTHILKGVSIAEDVVVAYGSIVTHNIESAHSIAAGIPAKIIKTGVTWQR